MFLVSLNAPQAIVEESEKTRHTLWWTVRYEFLTGGDVLYPPSTNCIYVFEKSHEANEIATM